MSGPQQGSGAARGWLVITLGVLCGLALTGVLRLWLKDQRPPGTSRPIADKPGVAKHAVVRGGSRLEVLRSERAKLLLEIQKIESELSTLVSVDSFAGRASASQTDLSNSQCQYDFTVYVYPIPPSSSVIRVSEEARRNRTLHVCQKCILEQFSLEYIIYDFFTSFCGRTDDPAAADFFYLPLVRDAEFRQAMESFGTRYRNPSAAEDALLDALEKGDTSKWKSVFGVTDVYWHRKKGADHIVVMPAPVTNLRHETGQRGFFHYMSHLHSPIFLHLEYSKQFVEEYPICATQKNIMLPYPTTDPDLFSGKLTAEGVTRDRLLYYAGGTHGECMEVRQALRHILSNSTKLRNVVPAARSNQQEREMGFLQAKYCPIPIGDSPSSKRMYDVLNFGCVPIVVSDDLVWALSEQTGGPLNHSAFSLQIPQSVVHYSAARSLRVYSKRRRDFGVLPSGGLVYDLLAQSVASGGEFEGGVYVNPLVQILRRIPDADYRFLLENGRVAGAHYRYYALNKTMTDIPTAQHVAPDGGAIQLLAASLKQKRDYSLSKLHAECEAERGRKHVYIPRYTCDGRDTVDSLLPIREKPKPRPKAGSKKAGR